MKLPITSVQVLDTRQRLDLNQKEFWSRVGVTQSGGSRYENDRKIPKPVQSLMMIAFGTEAQSAGTVRALRGSKAPT
jgi:transcriptional regulator with XRE-family HTH domain